MGMQKKYVERVKWWQPVYNVFQIRRKELSPF